MNVGFDNTPLSIKKILKWYKYNTCSVTHLTYGMFPNAEINYNEIACRYCS